MSVRPGSHHAMALLLDACGAVLLRVVVEECDNNEVYYTGVTIEVGGQIKVLDIRPSDALALSHVCKAPFLVKASLLEETDYAGGL